LSKQPKQGALPLTCHHVAREGNETKAVELQARVH